MTIADGLAGATHEDENPCSHNNDGENEKALPATPGQSHLNLFHSRPPTIILTLSKDRPPNHHHPEPPTLHPELVEGLCRLGVARGDEMDKTGPTLAYYVYMLRCSVGSYYVGHANDLEHRLAAHERGAIEGYTLSRRPVELVFSD